jgi:hypothetical protein
MKTESFPANTTKPQPAAYCHIYGQVGQSRDRLPEVLAGLVRRGIPADIDFELSSSPQVLAACRDWQERGNIVAPNVYPPTLDPACTNNNWWSYSEEECVRLLEMLRERLVSLGFKQTDAINTYTPGNRFVSAAKKMGFRHLLGFCGPTCANDGHWQLTHTGAPLAPFFSGPEDYRKPEDPGDSEGFLISNMELRNPLTCVENWNEGPFCPLNLVMGDRTIETGEFPLETIALCDDFIRLGELTGTPRFFHINLQYFTSPKCFDLNERMLDWLKVQQQCGRIQFIGLRDYAKLARRNGGLVPQTTWWRGECMGQHVGGQRGEGNEAIICENTEGQWQFRRGFSGAERYFDYRKTWNYPPFHPKAELPLSEGYGVNLELLETTSISGDVALVKFRVAASGDGVRRFCLWDALRDVSGPFQIVSTGVGISHSELVPHPGGSGAALLLDADLSRPFEGEVRVRHSGARLNDHSRNWRDLVVAETMWLHGQAVTRLAVTVPYALDFSVTLQSRSPVRVDSILGKEWNSSVIQPGGIWAGRLDGSLSSSVVRFWGVTAAQVLMSDAQCDGLLDQAIERTSDMAVSGGVTVPQGEILRYGPEDVLPAWVHAMAKNGADAGIAKADELAARDAASRGGRIVASLHMAADLPFGTKGRVRSAFSDRNVSSGEAELFAIYYDYGQTYEPGVSGWNQFWRVNIGARGLQAQRNYAVLLNVYDPEGRMTTLRVTSHATNNEGETVDSPEIVMASPFLTSQGLENRFNRGAMRCFTIPREVRGSEAVNVNIYSNGEQCIYDRLTEKLGFVFLSHAWLVELE